MKNNNTFPLQSPTIIPDSYFVCENVLDQHIPSITIYDDAVLCDGNKGIVSKECLKGIIDKLTAFYERYEDYYPKLIEEKRSEYIRNRIKWNEQREQLTQKDRRGYVYIMKNMGVYKIGRCSKDKSRLGEYTKLPEEPEYVMMMYVSDCYMVEAELHTMFADKRMREGTCEWFRLTKREIEEATYFSIQFMIAQDS